MLPCKKGESENRNVELWAPQGHDVTLCLLRPNEQLHCRTACVWVYVCVPVRVRSCVCVHLEDWHKHAYFNATYGHTLMHVHATVHASKFACVRAWYCQALLLPSGFPSCTLTLGCGNSKFHDGEELYDLPKSICLHGIKGEREREKQRIFLGLAVDIVFMHIYLCDLNPKTVLEFASCTLVATPPFCSLFKPSGSQASACFTESAGP
eukprot:1149926-Pelagomonas_calceolata.AAC.2